MPTQRPSTWEPPLSSKTCELCKIRHQKCNRTRPTCSYCQMRRAECIYSDIPANKVTATATRATVATSPIDASASASTKSKSRRVNDVISESETATRKTSLSGDLATSNSTPSTNEAIIDSPIESPSDSSASTDRAGSCKESSLYFLHDTLASFWAAKSSISKDQILEETKSTALNVATSPFPTISGHKNPTSMEQQLPNKATATQWLNTFLRGPNMLYRICNEVESWRLLDSIYVKEYIEDTSKCSIWLQLAIGCRFTTGTAEKSYTTLFESGCQYLEWCIEQADEVAPLWIMPSMLLSCLYFMDSKPKTCWLTLGAAIRLAQVHKIDRENLACCPNFSEDEYERWREVWRATITLDTWLSTTLGKPPQINQNTTNDSFVKMTLEELALPNPSIEINIAKLSVLVSRFLSSLCEGNMNFKTQEVFFHTLEEWASKLPGNLRYFPDIDNSQLSQADEVASLYLETFYFASVMTLTKPALLRSLSAGKQQNSPHSRLFSQTCVDASAQIGHAASRLLQRGFLCKRSWLVTTMVYHAGLVLALSLSVHTTSLRYNLKPLGRHSQENEGLRANMNILSTNAPHDPLARHHHEVLHYFRKLIESNGEGRYISTSQNSRRELFGMPHSQPTPLSWRDSTTSTTSSLSPLWQTSSGSSISSYPSSLSYETLAGSDYAIPTTNDLSRPTVTSYGKEAMLNPMNLDWSAPLSNSGSNYTFVNKQRSHTGSTDSGLGHYKPYMENFWSPEAFEFGQQLQTEDNIQTLEFGENR